MFLPDLTQPVAVVGGGPAGLMAAEMISRAGMPVAVYDSMRSVGRKFLMAGRGGLNLTHSERYELFVTRYGRFQPNLSPYLDNFNPDAVRQWVRDLGFETFVGSSGRIFPTDMKASPLLRAWLQRLQASGVTFHMRHRWVGWDAAGALQFETPEGLQAVPAAAMVLALGGGSWPRLGSDGGWVPILTAAGVPISPLLPSNCGFDVGWRDYFRERFAGAPLKSIVLTFTNANGEIFRRQGECVVTQTGIEGSLIYAVSAQLRDMIAAQETAVIHLDLLPNRTLAWLQAKLSHPRGSRSLSSHIQSRVGLRGVKKGLLYELLPAVVVADPGKLAEAIKALPIRLTAPRPLAEAISSAGGVSFAALDDRLMLRSIPGVFCAGEMLDWEAPTGGYLLTACFATGRAAGSGVADWLGDMMSSSS